jgi:hypothetical protein
MYIHTYVHTRVNVYVRSCVRMCVLMYVRMYIDSLDATIPDLLPTYQPLTPCPSCLHLPSCVCICLCVCTFASACARVCVCACPPQLPEGLEALHRLLADIEANTIATPIDQEMVRRRCVCMCVYVCMHVLCI